MSDSEPQAVAADPSSGRFQHLELFHGVDLDAAAHLLRQCHEVTVEPGDFVLEDGARNASVFLVIRGELEVRLGARDGAAIVTVGNGACVGELSILGRHNVTAWVVATRASRLLVIPEDLVWALVASSHEFARNLLEMLSGRLRDGNARFLDSLDAQERYQKAAKVDGVTGLFNRRWFDEILERQCRRAESESCPLSVLFLDIDKFKDINDRYGHIVGDDALRAIAAILQASVRPVDLAARFGGEEFAVVLLGIDVREAQQVAQRLRQDIEQNVIYSGDDLIHTTVSVGVAELRAGESPADLVAAADAAMYQAKAEGRNCVVARPPALPQFAGGEPLAAAVGRH